MSRTINEADQWGERLARRLGFWSAVAVLVGSTIGSGIFRVPAVVAGEIGDPTAFLIAWTVGGAVALTGALTIAELCAAYPRSGGIYVFLREAFGPGTAFLFGWAELLVIRPASYGAIAITSSSYFLRVMGVDGAVAVAGLPVSYEQLLGAGLIGVVGMVNYRGIQWGAVLQNVSTLFKVAALVLLVVIGFAFGERLVGGGGGEATVRLSPFLVAMIAILWAYDGWADISFIAGEVRDPQRVLPKALVVGTVTIVALYLAANLVYLYLIPIGDMPMADLIAADVARLVVGPVGVTLVGAAVAVSTFGTLNGSMMTAPRIFYALAEDRLFFRAIARVDPATRTPTAAIVLAVGLGMGFVLVRTFAQLANQFVIGIWPFYALAVLAVFILRRRRPDLERPYRVWGFPVVPIVFLVASVFLLGNYLVAEPLAFTVNVAVILAGLPIYAVWRSRRGAEQERDAAS